MNTEGLQLLQSLFCYYAGENRGAGEKQFCNIILTAEGNMV